MGKSRVNHGKIHHKYIIWENYGKYPLVNVYIAMEHHHVELVNQLSMAFFNSKLLVYQRVNCPWPNHGAGV
jgi:hypothetical protein